MIKSSNTLPDQFFVRDDKNIADLDRELFPALVESVRLVLSGNSAFNGMRSIERDGHVLFYQHVPTHPLIHLRHGYAFNVAGGRQVWRHVSTAVRVSLSRILQQDSRTRVFFCWPVWSMAEVRGDAVVSLPKEKVKVQTVPKVVGASSSSKGNRSSRRVNTAGH